MERSDMEILKYAWIVLAVGCAARVTPADVNPESDIAPLFVAPDDDAAEFVTPEEVTAEFSPPDASVPDAGAGALAPPKVDWSKAPGWGCCESKHSARYCRAIEHVCDDDSIVVSDGLRFCCWPIDVSQCEDVDGGV